jgi:oligopeptide transport system substrate-binding protein
VVNADAIIAGSLPPEELGVEATGPHTLVMRLRSPTPYILDLCTHPSMAPVHRPSIEEHGDAYGRPENLVSNGAFVVSEWVVGSYVAAERNTEYWGNSANAIDKVIFYNTVDTSAELQRYRADELDFTGSIPLPQFNWIKQNLGKELHISPYLTTYYYGLNLTRPPFAGNVKLRQALAMAVDRELLTERITGTGELPAYGWVPPGTNYYTPQSFSWANLAPQERIAEAQRLYAEAGYSRERPLRVELRYNTADLHRRVAVAVGEMWKEHLGVELTLVNEEFRVMIQNIREKQVTEIFRSSWVGDYNDAFTFSQFLHTDFGLNLVGYANPKYDALLEQAAAETDLRRRRALLEEAERLMLADTPLIPLYFHVSRHLVKPHVRGWRDNIMNTHYSKHLSLQ